MTYSDEEIKQILHSLFVEKRKVKEMDNQLQELLQNREKLLQEIEQTKEEKIKTSSSEEINKLKQIITSLKNKYTETLDNLEKQTISNQKLKDDLESEINKRRSLETELNSNKVLLSEIQIDAKNSEDEINSLVAQIVNLKEHFLQNKENHESQQKYIQENQALKLQLQDYENLKKQTAELQAKLKELSELYFQSQDQIKRQKQQIEGFNGSLQEKDRAIQEFYQFEYRYKKIQEQKNILEEAIKQDQLIIQSLQNENANNIQLLSESRQHAEQLERVIQYLRERSEESKLELNEIEEEFQNSRNVIAALTQELKSSHEETESLSKRLQHEQFEKNEAFAELSALQSQFDVLKNKINEQQIEINSKNAIVQEASENYESINLEKVKLGELVQEKTQYIEEIKKEFDSIQNDYHLSMQEIKNFETLYQKALDEKHACESEMTRLNEIFDTQKREIDSLNEKYEQKVHQENELMHELTSLKTQMEDQKAQQTAFEKDLQNIQDVAREKDRYIDELNHKVAMALQEKQRLEINLQNLKNQNEEQESNLKIAQQHLAKKVKEATLYSEKIDEQNMQISDLQNALNVCKSKIVDIQNQMDQQTQQDKQLQERLQDTIKLTEVQLSKWEEKYFNLCGKLQEVEIRNKELVAIEEKYYQMQTLFANLGTMMSSPVSFSSPAPAPTIHSQQPKGYTQIVDVQKLTSGKEKTAFEPISSFSPFGQSKEEEKEIKKVNATPESPSKNLFDIPPQNPRPRQNLFD